MSEVHERKTKKTDEGGFEILQLCGKCGSQIGTFSVKKENMMLISKDLVWCSSCDSYTPEIRDIPRRQQSIEKERDGYPQSTTFL